MTCDHFYVSQHGAPAPTLSTQELVLRRKREASASVKLLITCQWTPRESHGEHEESRALFQYPIRRLIIRSRRVSKPWDLYLELSDRSEIGPAPRQQRCRSACQISKRYEQFNPQSRAFETWRDLTIRHLIRYWNGAQFTKSLWAYNPKFVVRIHVVLAGWIIAKSGHNFAHITTDRQHWEMN